MIETTTIDAVFDEFLADQRTRLAVRTMRNYTDIIELFRSCLNGYGHLTLGPDERSRWEAAFDEDEDAFVHLFGPDKIAENLDEFLGYFMIRKVAAGEELLRAAGTVTKKLAKWLAVRGYLDAATADDAVEAGADAARDLPNADKLAMMLFDQARSTSVDLSTLADGDHIEEYLMIDEVQPGSIWFEGGIGPVNVPRKASAIAEPGWSMSITLGRVKGTWRILEVGNVYP